MAQKSTFRLRRRTLTACFFVLLLVLPLVWHVLTAPTYGAQLGKRSLQVGNAAISANTIYKLAFTLASSGTVGSIDAQFCSNDPLPDTPCTAPTGFDISQAVLSTQSGVTGFSISPNTTTNNLILTRTPGAAQVVPATYEFTNVTNPSVPGSYYVRVQTYVTSDATGASNNYGGLAFAMANSVSISAEVPPYLIFCTGITISGDNCANAVGDYIDFGELSSSHTSSGSSQMLVSTNAVDGFSISVTGTTLTSGSNIIAALNSSDVSRPGVGQFGFNLVANATPTVGDSPSGPGVSQPETNYDQPDYYRFDDGDLLVSDSSPENVRVFTASYIVNVPNTQAPGVYVSTLTYGCIGKF